MKNHLRHLGLVTILLCCLNSCISKKEIVRPLPREIVTINDHYYNDNLDALIKDYTSYPQYKEYIYELLFIDFDFSAMSYEDIFFIKEKNAYNSELYAGFKEVLKEREYEIVDQLQYMSIDSLNIYYMKHPVQRGFIGEFIDTTIIRVLPDLEYPEIKYLANLFNGTQVGEKMHKIQEEQKIKKTTIIDDLNEFTLRESESLENFKNEIEAYAMLSAFENIETFMGKMMRDDFPKEEKEVLKIANNLIRQTMSVEVEKHVANKMLEYVNVINDTRKTCFISLSDDSIKAITLLKEEMFVNCNDVKLPQYRIRYNPEPLYMISKKQNKRDWIGGALTIISLFDPTNITDAIDLAYGVGATLKIQHDIKNQILKFINDFADAIRKSSQEYSENVANIINKELAKSHEIFKSETYEIY